MHAHAHKFDPARMDYLESEERRQILDPAKILGRFGIKEGWVALDVGCGPGFFTFPLAELVGPRGQVYGIDLQPAMLERLDRRIKERGIKNIKHVLSGENRIPLPAKTGDFALLSAVLHELEGIGTLVEVERVLKDHATLGVVEWKKIEEEVGPPIEQRLSEQEAAAMLREGGFDPGKSSVLRPSHYTFTARKA